MLRRKSIIASLLLVGVLFSLLPWNGGDTPLREKVLSIGLIPKVEAQSATTSSSFLSSTAQKFFTVALDVFVVLNWIGLSGSQALLDPDIILGNPNPTTGIRPMEGLLHGIWTLSRNIVNGIFALILLAGGIYLIVGAGGEGMSKIKQAAPKFVLAVILVNFSWFFPRVILDAANVMTSVVYQIPSLANPSGECIRGTKRILWPDGTLASEAPLPCEYVWKVHFSPPSEKKCAENPQTDGCPRPSENGFHPHHGVKIGNIVDIYYEVWSTVAQSGTVQDENGRATPVSGASLVLNGLAVNFAKIPNLAIIDFNKLIGDPGTKTPWEQAQAFLQFLIHLILHVILSVAVGLALLALMAVLIVRMAVLWLCIAFMPFIFVGFAMGKPLGDLGKEGVPNIWQKFLSYAFLPVLVAIPFAIGFTLVSQLYSVPTTTFPINLNVKNLNFLKEVDNFHQLLWMLIAIGFIWFGTFAVLEKDEFASGIVKAVKGVGNTGLKVLGYGAAYGLQVPLPGGGVTSLGGTLERIQNFPQFIRARALQREQETQTPLPPPSPSTIHTTVTGMTDDQIAKLAEALRKANTDAVHGGTATALNDLANKLVTVLPIPGMDINKAKAIISNKESFKSLIEESRKKQAISGAEAIEIMRKYDEYQRSKETTSSTRTIDFNLTPGMGAEEAKKQVAKIAAGTLEKKSMSKEEVQQAIQNTFNEALDIQKPGIEQVLNEMKGDETTLVDRLNRIATVSPSDPAVTQIQDIQGIMTASTTVAPQAGGTLTQDAPGVQIAGGPREKNTVEKINDERIGAGDKQTQRIDVASAPINVKVDVNVDATSQDNAPGPQIAANQPTKNTSEEEALREQGLMGSEDENKPSDSPSSIA